MLHRVTSLPPSFLPPLPAYLRARLGEAIRQANEAREALERRQVCRAEGCTILRGTGRREGGGVEGEEGFQEAPIAGSKFSGRSKAVPKKELDFLCCDGRTGRGGWRGKGGGLDLSPRAHRRACGGILTALTPVVRRQLGHKYTSKSNSRSGLHQLLRTRQRMRRWLLCFAVRGVEGGERRIKTRRCDLFSGLTMCHPHALGLFVCWLVFCSGEHRGLEASYLPSPRRSRARPHRPRECTETTCCLRGSIQSPRRGAHPRKRCLRPSPCRPNRCMPRPGCATTSRAGTRRRASPTATSPASSSRKPNGKCGRRGGGR